MDDSGNAGYCQKVIILLFFTPILHRYYTAKVGTRNPLIVVGASGLEPPTPTMSRWCSNQLSYAPKRAI